MSQACHLHLSIDVLDVTGHSERWPPVIDAFCRGERTVIGMDIGLGSQEPATENDAEAGKRTHDDLQEGNNTHNFFRPGIVMAYG